MNDIITTACKFVTSSIGRKILVALTGACLLLFLVGHLAGNMTIFGGDVAAGDRSWIEYYATGLHSMPAWLLWSIRLGLLAVAMVHIVLAIVLKIENKNARTPYQREGTLKATISSRSMIYTGLLVLVFIVIHLWQLTINGDPAHCYSHVLELFQQPVWAIFYIVAILGLMMHVRHGFQSVLQTVGLSTRKVRPLYNLVSWAFAIIVCGAFILIPVCVMLGILK